jgi:hypothetical protein
MAKAQKARWERARESLVTGANENNCFGKCEAHHVSLSPQENRSRTASTMGEGEGGTEKGGVAIGLILKGPEASGSRHRVCCCNNG